MLGFLISLFLFAERTPEAGVVYLFRFSVVSCGGFDAVVAQYPISTVRLHIFTKCVFPFRNENLR